MTKPKKAPPEPLPFDVGDEVTIRVTTGNKNIRQGTIVGIGPAIVVFRDGQGYTRTLTREHATRRLQKTEPVPSDRRTA